MATRANIVVEQEDGRFKVIYTHFDGYLEDMGVKLERFYPTIERARALVKPGDIRALKERCGKPDDRGSAGAVFCTEYFGRDCGISGREGVTFLSLGEALQYCDNDYVYVRTEDRTWRFGVPTGNPMLDELKSLRTYIDHDEACQETWREYEEEGNDFQWAVNGEPGTSDLLRPIEDTAVVSVASLHENHPMAGGWA